MPRRIEWCVVLEFVNECGLAGLDRGVRLKFMLFHDCPGAVVADETPLENSRLCIRLTLC